MSFEQFKLSEEVLNGLQDVGFDKPTPIQEDCIPAILDGQDLLATSQTGTGKTAAFAIPILDRLNRNPKEGVQALIIAPTRELAQQIDEQFWALGYHTGMPTATVYGGSDWGKQEKALKKGVNIIVATPGRLLDQMRLLDVDFSNLDFLVLDEADRMLDMGFIPDIKTIISKLPEERQNLMFSATMPKEIDQLARSMMQDPKRINIASLKPAEGITQVAYNVDEQDKVPLVLHLFEEMDWQSAIIFTGTKRSADILARELDRKGINVTSIHGDRTQEERRKALDSFKRREFNVIVATDVLARGIDIDDVSHIINYSVPHDVEDYVHRIGRTARAESSGDAITLVSGSDRRYMESIIKKLDQDIKKLPVPDHIGKGDRRNGDSRQQSRGKGKPPHKKGPGPKKHGDSDKPDRKDSYRKEKSHDSDEDTGLMKKRADKSRVSKEESAGTKGPDKPKPKQGPGSGKGGDSDKGGKSHGVPADKKQGAPGDRDDDGPKKGKPDGDDRGRPKGKKSGPPRGQRGGAPDKQGGPSDKPDKGEKPQGDKPQKEGRGPQKGQAAKRGGRKPEPEHAQGDDRSRGGHQKGGPRKGGPQKEGGSSGGPQKGGAQKGQKPSRSNKQEDLIDKVRDPDTEKIEKSLQKKKGVWQKIKGLFSGE